MLSEQYSAGSMRTLKLKREQVQVKTPHRYRISSTELEMRANGKAMREFLLAHELIASTKLVAWDETRASVAFFGPFKRRERINHIVPVAK